MAFLKRRDDDFLPPEPREPREPIKLPKLRLSQGIQMVLVFVVTLAAALACAFGVLVPALRPESASAHPSEAGIDYSQPTAREAYVPALELARETDVQAELMSAAAVWTPPVDREGLVSGRGGWTFFFYLPATGEMLTVAAGAEMGPEVVSVEPWATPPSLFDDERWRIDSPGALAVLQDKCGSALDEAPDAQVEVRLSTASANLTLLWAGRVLAGEEAAPLCEVNVDAVTGLPR